MDILTNAQHAFRKARSTETQLILTIHDLANNLDNHIITDLAILDFSKAFDVVPTWKTPYQAWPLRNKRQDKTLDSILALPNDTKELPSMAPHPPGKRSSVESPQGNRTRPPPLLIVYKWHQRSYQQHNTSFSQMIALCIEESKALKMKLYSNKTSTTSSNGTEKWGMRFHTKKCNTIRISNSKNKDAHIYTMNGTPLKQTNNCQYCNGMGFWYLDFWYLDHWVNVSEDLVICAHGWIAELLSRKYVNDRVFDAFGQWT